MGWTWAKQTWLNHFLPYFAPSAGELCFYRIDDWWTYVFCYKKYVRQFHKEKEAITSEFSLGNYDEAAADVDAVLVGRVGVDRSCFRVGSTEISP